MFVQCVGLGNENFMRTSFLILALIIASISTKASHIVGGEIHYEHLGGDQYKVWIKLYRDCYNGASSYPQNLHLAFYKGIDSTLFLQIDIPVPPIDTVPNSTGNPCLIVPPNICVEEAIYDTIVTLPPIPGGYMIVYQVCCRNTIIDNVDVSGNDVGASYTAFIPDTALAGYNSDPYYNLFPPTVICTGYPFSFDHSATDLDGDSLVYALCELFSSDPGVTQPNPPNPPPFPTLPYVTPYTYLNPMGGAPPLAIDPQTGLLTITPTGTGTFVVGICVKEYRDGILLSEHKRDFQFNLTNCTQVTAEIVAPPAPNVNYQFVDCANFLVDFPNNSTPDAIYYWDFGINGIETDTSTLESPQYVYPDTGLYLVTLIVNPGLLCSDTAYAEVLLYDTLLATAGPADTIICPGESVQIWSSSGATYQWTPAAGLSNPSISNPIATPESTTVYTLVSTLGLCSASAAVQIVVSDLPTLTLVDDLTICPEDSVQLLPQGVGQFSWTPSEGLSETNIQNPWASPDNTTLYKLTVHDPTSCIPYLYDSVLVNVLTSTSEVSPETTIILGTSTDIFAFGGATYLWSPAVGLSDPNVANPVASPTVNTTYTVLITFDTGCTLEKEVVVNVNPNPQISFPNAFTPNGDGLNDIFRPTYLGLVTVDIFKVFNRWGEVVYESKSLEGWNGKYKDKDMDVGSYAYFMSARATASGTPIQFQGNVALMR